MSKHFAYNIDVQVLTATNMDIWEAEVHMVV